MTGFRLLGLPSRGNKGPCDQVTAWKTELLENAAAIFGRDVLAADGKERIRMFLRDLGTAFNVTAHDDAVTASVTSGKIQVIELHSDGSQVNPITLKGRNASRTPTYLTPGDLVRLERREDTVLVTRQGNNTEEAKLLTRTDGLQYLYGHTDPSAQNCPIHQKTQCFGVLSTETLRYNAFAEL